MKHHQVCRLATHSEREVLARYLMGEEFGKDFLSSDQKAVEQAVEEASITVFPEYYPDGCHQAWVIWSKHYPQLPNHPEHFKLAKDGSRVERIYLHTRHKYHRSV